MSARAAFVTVPDGQTTTIDIDARRWATSITDAAGKSRTYTFRLSVAYDAAGRGASTVATDGTAVVRAYESSTTGGAGRPISLTTGEGSQVAFSYNGALLGGVSITGDAWSGDTTAPQPPVAFEYDDWLRPTSEKVGSSPAGQVDYDYDTYGDLTSAGPVTLTYDSVTRDPLAQTAGDTSTQLEIDGYGELQGKTSTATASSVTSAVLDEQIVRDNLGRITQRTETIGASTPQVYGYQYDAAGNLTTVTLGGATIESYCYDVSDGLTSKGAGIFTTSITTDGHGRPTSTSLGASATWTADGELATYETPSGDRSQFAYDGFGRLTQVTLPDGRVGRYRYDAFGRRTAVRLDGTMVRRYVYGGAEFPRARIDADGDILERYVYATQAHVPDVIERRDGQRLRLVTDALGSVRATVDIDTGTVLQRLAYDAYGNTTLNTNPGLQPFGFKGSLSDPVAEGAGLTWMGVRAYQPALARFTTPDPVGLKAGWNQHDALAGDPINLIDTDGRLVVAVAAVVAIAIAVVVAVNAILNARAGDEIDCWDLMGRSRKKIRDEAEQRGWKSNGREVRMVFLANTSIEVGGSAFVWMTVTLIASRGKSTMRSGPLRPMFTVGIAMVTRSATTLQEAILIFRRSNRLAVARRVR